MNENNNVMDLNRLMKTDKSLEETMTFTQAMQKIIEGKSIRRTSWEDKEFYGILKAGKVQLHKPDHKYYDWIISSEDVFAEDWIVVN